MLAFASFPSLIGLTGQYDRIVSRVNTEIHQTQVKMNLIWLPREWEDLPEHLLVKIFLNLCGKSLHRCRQVSKRWNLCIVENIWGISSNKGILEAEIVSDV